MRAFLLLLLLACATAFSVRAATIIGPLPGPMRSPMRDTIPIRVPASGISCPSQSIAAEKLEQVPPPATLDRERNRPADAGPVSHPLARRAQSIQTLSAIGLVAWALAGFIAFFIALGSLAGATIPLVLLGIGLILQIVSGFSIAHLARIVYADQEMPAPVRRLGRSIRRLCVFLILLPEIIFVAFMGSLVCLLLAFNAYTYVGLYIALFIALLGVWVTGIVLLLIFFLEVHFRVNRLARLLRLEAGRRPNAFEQIPTAP